MTPDPAKGLLLGLTTGVLCLTHCGVVLLPTLAVTRDSSVRSSILRLAEYSLGRALACLGLGFALGWASPLVAPEATRQFLALLYIPLGALLLLHVLRESRSPGWICGKLQAGRTWIRTPFLLGAAAGVVPCAPFGIAMVAILESVNGGALDRAFQGALFFGMFFLGTTVFLLPLVFAGIGARFDPVRRAARALATVAALFFIFSGLNGFLHPEGARAAENEPLAVEEGDLRYVFPEADGFSSRIGDDAFPYYWALRKETVKGRSGDEVETTARIGVCFVTSEVAPGIRGWTGEVPVLVGLSGDGSIRGIKVLPGANRETPGFIDPLYEKDFEKQYEDKSAGAPFEVGVDVDGVTGATMSVHAVNEGVRRAGRKVAVDVLGIDPGTGSGKRKGFLPAKPGPYFLLGLAILAGAGYAFRAGFRFRTAVMVLSILLLGVWRGFYVTGADLSRAFTWNTPPGSSALPWIFLIATAGGLAFLLGKLYCGWLCPFGAVTEILYRLWPWKITLSEKWEGRLRHTRFLFLLALPALIVIAQDPGAARFEPLSTLFHPRSLTVASGVLLAWVLLASLFVERFYCKFLCPLGAVSDLLATERLLMRKTGTVCGGCVLGEKGCRFLREQGRDFTARRERLRGDCIC